MFVLVKSKYILQKLAWLSNSYKGSIFEENIH